MVRAFLFLSLILGLIFITDPSYAHKGATGIVKERMDLFKQMKKTSKSMWGMISGEVEFDAKAVQEGAELISNNAKIVLDKFPHGSLSDVSEAKKNIWTDWATFKMGMQKLSETADDVALSVKIGDRDRLNATFEEMANTCRACHKVFREKK